MGMITAAVAWLALASAATSATDLSGKWTVTARFSDVTTYMTMNLVQSGQAVSGKLGSDIMSGVVADKDVSLTTDDGHGLTRRVHLTLKDGVLYGSALTDEGAGGPPPYSVAFEAYRMPEPHSGAPQRLEFAATEFHHSYSATSKPALIIAPGDVVHTATIDAGGVDMLGVKRSVGPDPLIGPFYVSSASPGDVLAVHIIRLRLNRDWAGTGDNLMEGALSPGLARRMTGLGHAVKWRLDREHAVGSIENVEGHLAHYTLALRPMLGCVGVAEAIDRAAPMSNDAGPFGGNMDLPLLGEGATVYLPVRVPGALLYLGDAHAAQGDGEINGNALETSMDVEFSVSVLHERPSNNPRVETGEQLVAMGLGGSLDDAFKYATGNMAGWLGERYALVPSEVAQVIGTSAQYQVTQIPGRNVGIVLKIDKAVLKPLEAQPAH